MLHYGVSGYLEKLELKSKRQGRHRSGSLGKPQQTTSRLQSVSQSSLKTLLFGTVRSTRTVDFSKGFESLRIASNQIASTQSQNALASKAFKREQSLQIKHDLLQNFLHGSKFKQPVPNYNIKAFLKRRQRSRRDREAER